MNTYYNIGISILVIFILLIAFFVIMGIYSAVISNDRDEYPVMLENWIADNEENILAESIIELPEKEILKLLESKISDIYCNEGQKQNCLEKTEYLIRTKFIAEIKETMSPYSSAIVVSWEHADPVFSKGNCTIQSMLVIKIQALDISFIKNDTIVVHIPYVFETEEKRHIESHDGKWKFTPEFYKAGIRNNIELNDLAIANIIEDDKMNHNFE